MRTRGAVRLGRSLVACLELGGGRACLQPATGALGTRWALGLLKGTAL